MEYKLKELLDVNEEEFLLRGLLKETSEITHILSQRLSSNIITDDMWRLKTDNIEYNLEQIERLINELKIATNEENRTVNSLLSFKYYEVGKEESDAMKNINRIKDYKFARIIYNNIKEHITKYKTRIENGLGTNNYQQLIIELPKHKDKEIWSTHYTTQGDDQWCNVYLYYGFNKIDNLHTLRYYLPLFVKVENGNALQQYQKVMTYDIAYGIDYKEVAEQIQKDFDNLLNDKMEYKYTYREYDKKIR